MCPFEVQGAGPAVQTKSEAPATGQSGGAGRAGFRRELAGMSYSDQVQRVRPQTAGSADVQMQPDADFSRSSQEAMDDPVQMATDTGVAGAGDFTTIKPEDTLTSDHFKEFEKRYTKLTTDLGQSGDPKVLWLAVVTKLQATHPEWLKAPTVATPRGPRTDLESAAATSVMTDLTGIIGEVKGLMDIQAKGIKEWSFWSGTPALAVAKTVGTCLETSAIGAMFDGININGKWDIGLWGALSAAYAEAVAKNLTADSTLRGFVGLGSSTDQSIFNKIEQPKFKSICEDRQLTPTIVWLACVGKPGDISTPDDTATAGGVKGCIGTGDRASMVALAEAENNKRKAMPKAPPPP